METLIKWLKANKEGNFFITRKWHDVEEITSLPEIENAKEAEKICDELNSLLKKFLNENNAVESQAQNEYKCKCGFETNSIVAWGAHCEVCSYK